MSIIRVKKNIEKEGGNAWIENREDLLQSLDGDSGHGIL